MMQNTEHTAAPLLVRGGRVHDAVHPEPQQIDLLLENGRIVAMGHELNVPADIAVLDAAGLDIFPGFVDAHTHIGLDGYGIGYEGCDYNEMNDIWTPQLRAIDGINPRDPSFAHAREAGITCVCTGPGSANVLGGTFTAIKTVGERVDNMIVKEAVAMKCAFGENPKRCYKDKCDSTRMSTAAFLRGALASARDYGARKAAANGDVTKMPAYNQKLEAGPHHSPESPCTPGQRYFYRHPHCQRVRCGPDAGTCDRRPPDRGRTGQGKQYPHGRRPQPDLCQQV